MSSHGVNLRPERAAGAAVIERIEQALRERLATVPPDSGDSTRGGESGGSLRDPGSYEEQIEGSVARAEQRSREAEALMEEVTAVLLAWRERAAQLRQRLAEWPTRAL